MTADNALAMYTPPDSDRGDLLWDPPAFKHACSVAAFLAGSQMVPKHFQGKPADVLIGLQMARRLNLDPLTVLQSMQVVNGSPGWRAKFLIARINASGKFLDDLDWEITGTPGKDLRAVCYATRKRDNKRVEAEVTWQMAHDEGWLKNPKYKSMPLIMFRYRSATFFCSLYAPEILVGLPVADEVEDVAFAEGASVDGVKPLQIADQGGQAPAPQRGMAAVAAAVGTSQGATPTSTTSSSTKTEDKPAAEVKATPSQAAEQLHASFAEYNHGHAIPMDDARKRLRELLKKPSIREEAWVATMKHGDAKGWWHAAEQGRTLVIGPVPGEGSDDAQQQGQPDRWDALDSRESLLDEIEGVSLRVGDTGSERALAQLGITDEMAMHAPAEQLRELGRLLDAEEALLRGEAEGS